MRKVKYLLCVVCAMLFFMAAFNTYNGYYSSLIITPFNNYVVDQDYVQFNLNAVTQTYRFSDEQFAKDIVAFYEALPYDGYLHTFEQKPKRSDALSTSRYIYISNKSQRTFPNITFSKTIDWEAFNEKGNQAIITDDLSDVNAYAYFLPFNKFDQGVGLGLGNMNIVYTNIHNFNVEKYQSENRIVMMNFVMPKADVEAFKTHLKTTFIEPNYDCSPNERDDLVGAICGLLYHETESQFERDYASKMFFDMFKNPLEFPKVMLPLVLLALFFVLFQTSFRAGKEITVRRLHGNHELRIFQRLFIMDNLYAIFCFGVTLGIVGFFVLDFNHGATPRFCEVLLHIMVVFALGLGLWMVLFYLLMIATLRVSALKKTFKSNVVLKLSLTVKMILIVIFGLNLVKFNQYWFQLDEQIRVYDRKPYLKQGYTAIINYGYEKGPTEKYETDNWLFRTVEKYGYAYLDDLHFYRYTHKRNEQAQGLQYLVANRQYLRHEAIYDLEGNAVSILHLKKNTLLVSQDAQGAYEKYGLKGNQDVLFVKETGKFYDAYLSGTLVVNPPILVIVDDPAHYTDGIENSSIRMGDFNHSVTDFIKEVSAKIGQTRLVSFATLYQEMCYQAQYRFVAFALMSLSAVCSLITFSYVILTAYLENRRQGLALAYMHGWRRGQRYRLVLVLFLVSTVLLLTTLLIQNYQIGATTQILNQSWALWGLTLLVFLIDCTVLIQALRRFERLEISASLKR